MPRIPQIGAPENFDSPLNNGRVTPQRVSPVLRSPVQTTAVRANPGMYDAEFAAGRGIAQGLQDTADVMSQIQKANDAAYITRAQTQMEASNLDFQNWTKTNPDPSTWKDELDGRMSTVKDAVTEGGKSLSPLARKHLGLVVNEWDVSTRKRVQLQATEQNLHIAAASYNEFIAQATATNDLPGIEQKVAEAVKTGVFHPTTGQLVVKRARSQIQQNVANGMIEADPFEAERHLQEQDEKGQNVSFPGMSDTVRETLVFRAHKAAAQTRANTMRDWSGMVADAQAGRGPMPDRESVEAEAAHQGIAPKWVANLFKPPAEFDPAEYAAAYSAIASYDPHQDPTFEKQAKLVGQIQSFKGDVKTRLDSFLTQKMKPESVQNKPTYTEATRVVEQAFTQQFLGKWENKIPDPNDKTKLVTVKNEQVWQQAMQRKGQLLTSLNDWIEKHPDATPAEATKFVFEQMQPFQQAERSRIFRLPSATPTSPKK